MTSNTEEKSIVAISYEKDKLIEWYNAEFEAEPYVSIADNYFPAKGDFSDNKIEGQRFHKIFKRQGPLEWFNPLQDIYRMGTFGHGIYEEWIQEKDINSELLMV